MNERERSFLQNGSILLEDLISSCNGIYNPIRNFSAEEINIATNNFDRCHIIQDCECPLNLFRHGLKVDELDYYDSYYHEMYRGCLDDRPIIIKKFRGRVGEDELRPLAIRDMVITTQMSNHNNVLKLLGCCLEFPVPVLVLENAQNGALNDQGGFGVDESLPWKIRLQVAKKLANAVTYLHTALSRPVIHRDIRPNNIFLDHAFVPKFVNFSLSITIPPNQLHAVDTVKGDVLYVDPVYLCSGFVTQKSDVYSFGMLLLVLLTGKRPENQLMERYVRPLRAKKKRKGRYARLDVNNCLTKILDPKLSSEGGEDGKAQQIGSFLELALACTQRESETRPDMIDVAKELMRIEKSL